VVKYFPTLDMIKKDLLNMYNNNWGYCDTLRQVIEDDFEGEDLKKLILNDNATINILNELTKKSFTDFNHHYGIQNIETGELINRFYKKIFSYHPDQGYVLFEQDSERDFATDGADPIFRLVSLKTGKEFEEVLKQALFENTSLKDQNTSLKDQCDKIERDIDEVIKQKPTPVNRARLIMLCHKLHECRDKIKNALSS
jgi:hypothetical protein